MDLPFTVPGFENHAMAVRTAGMVRGPALVVNGALATGKRGRFIMHDAWGREVEIRVRPSLLGIDPIPTLVVQGRQIQLARPLTWYEYAWLCLPMLLVVAGGALGGLCGFVAAYSSGRIFRTNETPALKFLLSGAITFVALVVYLVLAAGVEVLLR